MDVKTDYLTAKGRGKYRILQWIGVIWLLPWAFVMLVAAVSLILDCEFESGVVGFILMAVNMIVPGLLLTGLRRQKHAVAFNGFFSSIADSEISFRKLDELTGKDNAIELLRLLIARGYLKGISIDARGSMLILRPNQREPVSGKCACCGANLPRQIGTQAFCAYCGSRIPME